MKKLTSIKHDYDNQDEVKYYKATVINKRYTHGGGNYFIECENCTIMKLINDTVLLGKQLPLMNYLVPKRRRAILKACEKEIQIGETYYFKLKQETYSKKWTVTEVFLI